MGRYDHQEHTQKPHYMCTSSVSCDEFLLGPVNLLGSDFWLTDNPRYHNGIVVRELMKRQGEIIQETGIKLVYKNGRPCVRRKGVMDKKPSSGILPLENAYSEIELTRMVKFYRDMIKTTDIIKPQEQSSIISYKERVRVL